MARPKSVFLEDLAERARADLETLDQHKITLKLRAIIAAAKYPVGVVAEILDVAAETVWRWAKAYQKEGLEGLYPKARAPKPSKLTQAQKAEVLGWLDECKTAKGERIHWTLERLRHALMEEFRVSLCLNTIWVWLRRENRKLKVPRPRHRKADPQAQEAFKKKLQDVASSRPDASMFFFDEGRFGTKSVVGRYWTRKDIRPIVTVQPGYENFYMYSAICPVTGEDVTLFLPWANTSMMNLFLEHFQEALSGRFCFLILDQAGWHVAGALKIPANVELIFLPPYSPELNPVERLWQWLKRHSLRNRFFENLENVMESVQTCFQQTTASFLADLCRCKYLLQ